MIIKLSDTAFRANLPEEKLKESHKYEDPLSKFPINMLTYSNSVGALIMDIAPKAGQCFWIPTLMYYGADIYDKYKSDKNAYHPSAKRGVKEVCFQAFSNIVFPMIAVNAGHKITSVISKIFGKDKISFQTQENIIEHHLKYMSNRQFENQDKELYKTDYLKNLSNYLDESSRSIKTKKLYKKIFALIFAEKYPEKLSLNNNIKSYAEKQIDKIFALRDNSDSKGRSKPVRDVMKTVEKQELFKLKLKKGIGGLTALLIFMPLLNKFIDKTLMKKWINPSIDKISEFNLNNFKSKYLSQNEEDVI